MEFPAVSLLWFVCIVINSQLALSSQVLIVKGLMEVVRVLSFNLRHVKAVKLQYVNVNGIRFQHVTMLRVITCNYVYMQGII